MSIDRVGVMPVQAGHKLLLRLEVAVDGGHGYARLLRHCRHGKLVDPACKYACDRLDDLHPGRLVLSPPQPAYVRPSHRENVNDRNRLLTRGLLLLILSGVPSARSRVGP